jgi:hypothetical protein
MVIFSPEQQIALAAGSIIIWRVLPVRWQLNEETKEKGTSLFVNSSS